MASWIITRDNTEPEGSPESYLNKTFWTMDAHQNVNKTEKFRLYDDDNHLYYEGFAYIAEEETGFEPLDWANHDTGCTSIQYWNEKHRCWDVL